MVASIALRTDASGWNSLPTPSQTAPDTTKVKHSLDPPNSPHSPTATSTLVESPYPPTMLPIGSLPLPLRTSPITTDRFVEGMRPVSLSTAQRARLIGYWRVVSLALPLVGT